ncbi:GSCOCG00000317001-RA-CDS [Cotesia congregata]|uniref:Serine/threonine-protein kinase ATM n=1 Tax=Cotesia congregata TaxID=51543 RepID=A0A8J2MPT9_COTCN|nr:GSCOCG00000317001-RA-CDS [Cotesia congregata]CAG5088353.1 Similar to ATM: Serine-protein kinase ATM (Sus scrofa) [Cotesia congregata]
MTSNSQKIIRILSNLDTGKLKIDQKESISELLIELEDEAARKEITENSFSETHDGHMKLTWHSLFIKCHEFVLNVAKKAKVPKSDIVQTSFCLLISDIVRYAITPSVVYLHTNDFVACIIQVLENEHFVHLHDTYLRLATYVVSNRHYRTSLSFDDWRKFFKIFIKMYDKSYISDQCNILQNLEHTVRFGCLQCNLLHFIKGKILPFLLKVSNDVRKNSVQFGQQAHKLFYAVCEQMGYENRKVLCEFSEKIMPRMLDDQLTEEKCKLILLFITLHHPNGAISSNPAAYAFELSKWKSIMINLYTYILQNMKSIAITTNFSTLASEVFYLIMMDHNFYEEETNLNDSESSRRVKRRRLSILKKPIDLFNIEYINDDVISQWYVVEILTVMVRKYPGCILNGDDFITLMKILSKLFAEAIKNEKIIHCLCELCKILLMTENITSDDKKFIQETKKYWEKIWHTLLKILCLEQNVIEGHKLLQLIITYVGIINLNEFICLYITNQIRWTPSSVYTFYIFSQNAHIPEYIGEIQSSSGESVKMRILQWILKFSSHTTITPLTVTAVNNVLTNLVLKIWYKKNSKNSLYESGISNNIFLIESEQKFIDDITKCYITAAFEIDLFKEQSFDLNADSTKKLVKPLFSEEILESTVIKLCESINFTEDVLRNTDNAILKLAIVAKFTSNLLELNECIINQPIQALLDALKQSLSSVYNFIATDNLLNRENHVIPLIKAFITLYETPYNNIITKLIVDQCPQQILIGFFDIINYENTNEPNGLDELGIKYYEHIFKLQDSVKKSQKYCKPLSYSIKVFDNDVITIAAHHAVRAFMCMNTNEKISEIQKKILANLLKVEIYAPTVVGNLWQSLVFLKRLIQCKRSFYSDELIIDLTKFINKLFHKWEYDPNAIKSIFEFLPFIYEYILDVETSVQHINEIILYTHNQLNNKFGPGVSFSFLNFLSKIIKLVPQKQLSIIDSKQQTKSIAEIILIYLKSPYYIVRLEAIKIIYYIFSTPEIDLLLKKNIFKAINTIQSNIFIIDNDVTDIWKEDEFINRTTTALYTFGSILRGSGLYQSQVLNSILRLYGEVQISIDSINKILKIVMKNDRDRLKLIEMNLYYLLRKWLLEKYSSKPFPWELTQSESEIDFYKRYMGTIILLKLEEHNLSAVETLCESIGYSFVKAIENCFPSLMTWLLVCLNLDSDNDHYEYAREILTRLRNNSDEFENIKKFSQLIEEKSYDLLIDLISRLHDEDHFRKMFQVNTDRFPRYNLPCLNLQVLEKCFQYLESNFPVFKNSLIYFLASIKPNILQKILLYLSNNIFEFNMIEYKLKAFHQYTYFCNYLVQKIPSAFFSEIVIFFIRDVYCTLLNLIKEEIDSLSELSVKFMYLFLRKILPSRSKEISKVLNFIVTNLTSAIQQSDKITETGIQILRFLTIDSNEILKEAISKLDDFPSHPSFEGLQINNSLNNSRTLNLRNKIEKFLESKYEQTATQSSKGLLILKDELAKNKNELLEMYKELEKLRGFAEDCTSSIIHRLIYRLIKLTENQNVNVSLDAAKCLGELGPADLTTMILHPEDDQKRESGDPAEMLTYQIIIRLVEFIIDKNVDLRKSSADALYIVCASPWSHKILKKNSGINSEEPMLLAYIQPFLTKDNNKNCGVLLNVENCKKFINPQNNLWKSDGINSYQKWLINITCKVLNCFNNFYSTILEAVCQLSTEFCETILPRFLYLIIYTNNNFADNIYDCINYFFEDYYNSSNKLEYPMTPNHKNSSKIDESFSHQSVRCMLNIVNFIRIQLDNNFILKLNYLHIAKAAQYCSAYFTSVLYAELYCETIKKSVAERPDNISTIDYICEVNYNDGKSLQNILRDAFVEIGDPDSIHGCGLSHLKNSSSRTQHYIHLQQWDKVMITQDAELSLGYKSPNGMANALRHSGFDYLLNKFISTTKNNDNFNEYEYETAWRLADWNFSSPEQHYIIEGDDSLKSFADKDKGNNYYYNYHYQALKCLHSNDNVVLKNYIDVARMSIIKSLSNASLECSQTVYPKLVRLQMLLELEELSISTSDDWDNLIDNWYNKYLPNFNDFMYVEPILAQRITMCKIKYLSSNNKSIKDALIKTYLELSKIAELQGYPHIAVRLLITLSNEDNLSDEIKNQLQFRDALLSWVRNDRDIARYLMRDLLNKKQSLSLNAQALRVYGNWMAETKTENPQAVIDNYYKESIEVSMKIDNKSPEDADNLNCTYAALAQFADAQYQQINTFMKTPQFESLKDCAKYAQRTNNLKTNSKDTDVNRALSTLKKQNSIDVAEYINIQNERKMYLELTTKYYLKTLETGESHNFFIFRLISLWLKNKDNNELYQLFNDHLNKIPSFKFIPLIPQLAPHLSDKIGDKFTKTIYELLKKCANEHPHHTLPTLFALMNTRKDYDYYKPGSNVMGEPNDRELGAKLLISELSKGNKLSPIILEMKNLALALIMLAYFKFEGQLSSNSIPRGQKILTVKNYNHCMVPTITLDVDPTGNYDEIVSIYKYEDSFRGVGGMNAPKQIDCIGTDGIRRKQLVKGKDDLRQDAVMQQVFTVMNMLLKTSKESKRRKLNVRTYKVIPLSQRSGILEWCDNTEPIFAILNGKSNPKTLGMHEKYHPNDWKIVHCKTEIKNVATSRNNVKLQTYLKCCKHLQPAFQYFFMEKFPSPETWFERRLAYVRSVATNSMVGYILGLGDRHFSNILLDTKTAEVIHIDFGIAFEQGKVLPVPETVPFRLTRDMEAAMGVSGVEGVMRKSSEETMSVLRNRKDIIITLLQVLLYDPLFSWAITPAKAWELQSDSPGHIKEESHFGDGKLNKIAERALLRIEQKLIGTEEGLATSISGQVERLIQEARDPANLSRLFCGWQAYL